MKVTNFLPGETLAFLKFSAPIGDESSRQVHGGGKTVSLKDGIGGGFKIAKTVIEGDRDQLWAWT
jgi:hypothetical protein